MRAMLQLTFPTARFNELWRAGQVGPKIKQIMEDTKPEVAYFGKGTGGRRGAFLVVDIPSEADLARISEPWYLVFEAEIELYIAMTPEDIGRIDYDSLAKQYG